jgi:AAA+ ATPase superfamily predicted ATPase
MAKSDAVIGRRREKQLLDTFLRSKQPELLAIYGRRRVGKTHLIREYCEPRASIFFSATGQHGAASSLQLFHFKQQLERTFYGGAPLPTLASWDEALLLMCDAVERVARSRARPIVLFFDELPWLATQRSRLVEALDYYWNTRLSRIPAVRLVLCGSAASWMLDKLIHAKGGLHNRITRRIRLAPFTLREASEYLASRGLGLGPMQVVEHYLALGGVPYYLAQVEKGRSAVQNIAAICFDRDGILADEFDRLFQSLFKRADHYEKIIRAVAKRRQGILRNELIQALRSTSGGRLGQQLRELEEAGFITTLTPYGRKAKHQAYRLIDEYVSFYLKWIEPAPKGVLARGGHAYWKTRARTPGYRAWSGYAFEGLCLKHAQQIRGALGIEAIDAEIGTWRYVPSRRKRNDRGAQVDLLFDRADGIINLCELKYAEDRFVVDKRCARELADKVAIFETKTGTKKDVHVTLVTTHGLKPNSWSEDLISNVVTVDALFA